MNLCQVRSDLAAIGLTPSKVLGQNFLHDANLARWIVGQLGADEGQAVVEVGPGLGALTRELAARGHRIVAIERDRKLAGYLERLFAESEGMVQVVSGDAARFDIRLLWPEGVRALIGNLPYSAAAPILFQFLQPVSPVQHAVIMVQSEMGERLAAGPGSPEYGSAAVVLQRAWQIALVKSVPPSVFHPRPRVDSVVMTLRRRVGANAYAPCEAEAFERLVRLGFSQRRKQLGKLLGSHVPDWPHACKELGMPLTVRAEELDIGTWVALSNLAQGWQAAAAQSPETEVFDVVDEHDQVLRQETRSAVHAQNLRHRAVHVFVFNRKGEIFLQRRSALKDRHPGVWDSSASGHLDAGESYDACAVRELQEELGISATPSVLARLDACPQTGWEFVQVYLAEVEGPFRLPPAEIETGCFFPLEIVDVWVRRQPQDFAPGFLACYAAARDQLPRARS